jgi:hypothetical protein
LYCHLENSQPDSHFAIFFSLCITSASPRNNFGPSTVHFLVSLSVAHHWNQNGTTSTELWTCIVLYSTLKYWQEPFASHCLLKMETVRFSECQHYIIAVHSVFT